MKYVFWGAVNQGKTDIILRCTVEEKPYILLRKNYIQKVIPIKNNNIVDENFYILIEDNNTVKEIYYRTAKLNIDNPFLCRERNPQISIDYIGLEQTKQIEENNKIFLQSGNVYNQVSQFRQLLDKVDYIILGDIAFLNESECIDKLASRKDIKHLVPYRIIKDPISLLSKINMYWGGDGDYFELYRTNKSKAFEFLDSFYIMQRQIEKTLIEHNVEITYFDLDSYDYTIWDLNSYQNRNAGLTMPIYNIDNPEIKRRYDLAYSIAQEYLDTRCLTDTRIRGAVIDGIEV